MSEHTGLAHSIHYDSLKKDNSQAHNNGRYSLLGHSGSSLISSQRHVDQGSTRLTKETTRIIPIR